MVSREVFDPFSSKTVLEFKNLAADHHNYQNQLQYDEDTEYIHLSEIRKPILLDLRTNFLKLQISHEDLPDLSSGSHDDGNSTTYSLQDGSAQESPSAEVDLWALDDLSAKTVRKGLLTWDQFDYPEKVVSDQKYITEISSEEFDSFQSQVYRTKVGRSLRIARPSAFQQALSNILFGRSSAFFVWNGQTSRFDLNVQDFAISGCSQAVSVKLCEYFAAFGSRFRRLQEYSRTTTKSHPTEFAFQRSVERTLHHLELHACVSRSQQIRCVDILRETEKMDTLLCSLEYLKRLSESAQSELHFFTSFIEASNEQWAAHSHLRSFLANVLSDVTGPAIRQTREILCLQQKLETMEEEVWLFSKLLPDLAKSVAEVKTSLAVLDDHFSGLTINRMDLPTNLTYTWTDVIDLQNGVTTLEERYCMGQIHLSSASGTQFQLKAIEEPTSSDPFSIDFNLPIANSLSMNSNDQHNRLPNASISQSIACLLSGTATESMPELSPVQTMEFSLRPIIEAQNRLTSFAVLKALFMQHELPAQLNALHAFCLFGNGSFVVRLATALFDSSQESIEGKRKSGLTGGLRLEDREAWPPASSELRLALNGIFSETKQATIPHRILDQVSFAIKDLSDEDAELCRDIHSIHALDFLRVTYVPSDAVLESIITPTVLEKYDRIFNFMLILLRAHNLCQGLMMVVIKGRSRSCSAAYNRLCIEANHFISTLLTHAMQSVTHSSWRAFEERIRTISQYVKANDYQKTMDTAKSVSHLCEDHAKTVDDILKGLLLKKKQEEALSLTCDIINLLLKFSSNIKSVGSNIRIRDEYDKFCQLRKKWFRTIQAICDSTVDPALQRLWSLLLRIDLSGSLRLSA